ncbi:MAG: ATP-binding protein [Verrucomicrobiota bacterium]|nr:ATP-binding protein [Verrucomicrobiota bacterium]
MQSRKTELLGQLAGGIAHDFNNYLQTITAFSQVDMEEVDSLETVSSKSIKEALIGIQEVVKNSKKVTEYLLSFCRNKNPVIKKMNINAVINKMLPMLCMIIGRKINVKFIPQQQLPQIYADSSDIEQILMNLCINAKDAIGEFGNITIETEKVNLNYSFCKQHPSCSFGEHIKMTISDDGPGIPANIIKKVLDPFFTTKSKTKGTGLGLANVDYIIKKNKGIISVGNVPEGGAEFKLYFSIPNTSEIEIETQKEENNIDSLQKKIYFL